ncbi:helix-turn-helix domain-containing protein [Clostridium tyrobutyricum]|uniref:helix-turn-helix domain-containing protein n=1 Tax=Clostridium tyrobutyricum TaxID=1519 RepID=UPI001C38014F|nr:helix-turn-helix transcriptional regulator [Clostridium tyrobutyricum]MBV4429039.1 helix-turn-helix domain-containing protein [Clostridium tyrobutyricum]MBV4444116.1 helix-turn-helix domain-containing protein [Clostridium tyrobutyricum]
MKSIFSKRLKEERLRNNLTQQELADLINEELEFCDVPSKKVSRVSITRYENDTRTPDYNTLCIISQVLETDLEYLLGKNDKKYYVAANEELNNIMKKIANIIEKDDKKSNDLLFSIINSFDNLLDYAIKNKALDNIENIFNIIEKIINISVNKNKPTVVKEANKILMIYVRYALFNINPDNLEKRIELYKQGERRITERLHEEKIEENELLKNNPKLKNSPKFEENHKKVYDILKKQLEDCKKKQTELENFKIYVDEEQKLIYKLLHHDEQHE